MDLPIAETAIRSEQDILLARRLAHHLADLAGLSVKDKTQLATAVSEIARNALQYARGGTVQCRVAVYDDRQYLEFVVRDRGPGIKRIEDVLKGEYRSRTGMGLGISGTKKLMDRFSVESRPSEGTTVTLAKALPSQTAPVTLEKASEWADILTGAPPSSTVERVRLQSQDTYRALKVLQHKEAELSQQLTEAERKARELLSCQHTLREQATKDPLTGLLNRREILDVLDRELLRSRRTGRAVGVIMADLDHFKNLNDTHGHLAGDAALKEAARRIMSAVRPYDCVGRYGGEEFLVVLPECGSSDMVAAVAERVRKAVGDREIEYDRSALSVTVSLGAASSDGLAGAKAIIEAADNALYRAKENGRNRVETGLPPGAGK